MSAYERFEQLVSLVLTLTISLIVLVALVQLVWSVVDTLILEATNPLKDQVFTSVFAMILTPLIAMEFKRSITRVGLRGEGIIQVRTVVLIAILALARKFIILDIATTAAPHVAALALATVVLGIVCWLIRDADRRSAHGTSRGESRPTSEEAPSDAHRSP